MTGSAPEVRPGDAPTIRRRRRFHDPRDRAWVWTVFLVTFVTLRLITWLVWSEGREPASGTEQLLSLGMWGWITTVPSVLAGMLAWIVPRRSQPRRGQLRIGTEVSWRVVSRGLNPEALQETVHAIRAAMEARPLFPYRIEVVTDTPVALPAGDDVVPLVVPADYAPPNGSKFKARALHWALSGSDLPADGWVVHLDEESHPTAGVVGGVRDFIADAQEAGDAPVGQGTILYYRHLRRRPLLTLADSLRTGDDISRFFAQYRMGKALFGMHGSFIVVRNDVAQGTGFDVGPDGSITEDAWWALQLLELGHRFAWVDGHIIEQAPESIDDFVRQRRRWFSGLVKVALYAPAPWWATAAMLSFLTLWAGATLGVLYTWLNIVLGLRTPTWLALTGAACYAWYVTLYVTGLRINLTYHERDLAPLSRIHKAVLYVLQVVGMPLFAALETAGVVYALVKPERGFHVIRKSASAPAVEEAASTPEPATVLEDALAGVALAGADEDSIPVVVAAAEGAPLRALDGAADVSSPSEGSHGLERGEDRRTGSDRRRRRGLRGLSSSRALVVRVLADGVVVHGGTTPADPDAAALLRTLALAGHESRSLADLAALAWPEDEAPALRAAAAADHIGDALGDLLQRSEDGDAVRLADEVLVERRHRRRRSRRRRRSDPDVHLDGPTVDDTGTVDGDAATTPGSDDVASDDADVDTPAAVVSGDPPAEAG